MARTNGKSEIEPQELDTEHELPASEDTGEGTSTADAPKEASPPAGEMTARDAERQKLKAERDTLLDRLARLQAEFGAQQLIHLVGIGRLVRRQRRMRGVDRAYQRQ